MTQLVDRLAVEIFRTHIDSLSAAKRMAERLLDLMVQEDQSRASLLEDIRLSLGTPETLQALRGLYHCTPQEALLLEYFVKRESLSLTAIMGLLQVNNEHSRVVISRLRRKTGLPIINFRGEGYALRADARQRLATQLKEEADGQTTTQV
jgi:DNA-binding response OmpR family regulator